jgi:hypothetical protein
MRLIRDQKEVTISDIQDIIDIRMVLEGSIDNFPYCKCQHSTRFSTIVIPRLKQFAGVFTPLDEWHAWNYDPKYNLYIDFTFDQFRYRGQQMIKNVREQPLSELEVSLDEHQVLVLEGVGVLPANTPLLKKLKSRTSFQRKQTDKEFEYEIERLQMIYNELYLK